MPENEITCQANRVTRQFYSFTCRERDFLCRNTVQLQPESLWCL